MHRLTFYLKFSRQRNTKCSAWRAGWVAMTASPLNHSRLQHAQIWNNEHKLENRIKVLIKFWFSPFCVCDSTSVPHSARTAKVTAQSVPSALGSWHSQLWRALGRLNPKRSSWYREKLESQGSAKWGFVLAHSSANPLLSPLTTWILLAMLFLSWTQPPEEGSRRGTFWGKHRYWKQGNGFENPLGIFLSLILRKNFCLQISSLFTFLSLFNTLIF